MQSMKSKKNNTGTASSNERRMNIKKQLSSTHKNNIKKGMLKYWNKKRKKKATEKWLHYNMYRKQKIL